MVDVWSPGAFLIYLVSLKLLKSIQKISLSYYIKANITITMLKDFYIMF